jgi:hypothetical protein
MNSKLFAAVIGWHVSMTTSSRMFVQSSFIPLPPSQTQLLRAVHRKSLGTTKSWCGRPRRFAPVYKSLPNQRGREIDARRHRSRFRCPQLTSDLTLPHIIGARCKVLQVILKYHHRVAAVTADPVIDSGFHYCRVPERRVEIPRSILHLH